MNIYQKACFAVALIGHFFTQQNLFASNLDGTSTLIFKPQHHVFSNNESAIGLVRMGGGFTIKAGANARLDTVVSVSGAIDLRETGILQLLTDLKLDNNLTWSSGGYINGRGKSIILNDTLTIPASKIIRIIGDTIIDGQGSNLILSENAQIIVESNATLTLRNLTLQNIRHSPFNPCLRVVGNSSKLALDNVKLAITGDMQFAQGQLYIYNDVVFSGTSSFIYTSPALCSVLEGGTFLFDINTTLSFAPASAQQNLFSLQGSKSTLSLNGCTLKVTSSGMRLTKGRLCLANKVYLWSNPIGETALASLSPLTSRNYGSGIEGFAWDPSGRYLAAVGNGPVSDLAGAGFADTNEVRLYSFDGSTLTAVTSVDFGTVVRFAQFDATGTFLIICGGAPTSGDELQIYRFNGSSLTFVTSVDFGNLASPPTQIRGLDLHPAGGIIAVGGDRPSGADSNELRLYRFDGTNLTLLTSQDYGSGIYAVKWHPSGNFIAVAGSGPVNGAGGFANTNEIRLYSFNGSTLTALTSQDYGTAIWMLDWNPDGTVLAVGGQGPVNGAGGFANTNELRLYNFNGLTLTALTSANFDSSIEYVAWHPSGTAIAAGGSTAGVDLQLFGFDGSALTLLDSKDYGGTINSTVWNPAGNVLAIGGPGPAAVGGFANTDEIRLYTVNFYKVLSPNAFSRSLVFGNSALGSDYDLNVEVLGGAYVTIDGKVMDDSA